MTLQELLEQLPNIPQGAPVPLVTQPGPPNTPTYGGPSQVTEPPTAPIDNRIAQQYASLAGAPPTPPPQPTFLDKLGAVLGGAAFGPQFAETLPGPRYRRELADYNANRQRLGVMGFEAAQRDVERRTERAQRLSDIQLEREYRDEARRLNLFDDESKMRLQHAFTLERDARQARLEQTRELERERRAMELDAKQKTSAFFTASKNMALSRELGAHYAGLSDAPLSAAAVRLDRQLQGVQQARMGRAMGGGGRTGSSNAALKAVQNFEAAKQAVIQAVGRGDVRTERLARRKMDAAVGQLARFPAQIEYGGDPNWPYAKLRGAQPGQQPQAGNIKTMAEIRSLAAQAGISEQEGVARAQAAGFQVVP